MGDSLTTPIAAVAADSTAVSDWRRAAGYLRATLSLMIFSGWFVITRFSVTRELQIWDIMALRFGVGALVLAPTILRPGARLPVAAWREGLLLCLLWGASFVLLVALGLGLTSAAQAASIAPAATAIIGLLPAVASLLAIPVLGEMPLPARWAAIVMIGIGVGLAAKCPSVRSAVPKHPT